MKLSNTGMYLVNGRDLVAEGADATAALESKFGKKISKAEAKENTIAYGILKEHNVSGNMESLQIKFDKLTSHDITYVGIIQTARASGLTKFPMTTCLDLPVRRSMAVFMFRLIRQLSTSLREKCLRAVEK